MKKNDHKSIDNTYGGVRYRFSYDDSRRAAAVRILRKSRRGARSFQLTVGAVSLFCLLAAGFAVIYRGVDAGVTAESAVGVQYDDAVAVNASVYGERSQQYGGYFCVSDMNERAYEAYHMPSGVMVSEVYEQRHSRNQGLIENGDIIVAVDGVETPDVATFDPLFDGGDKETVKLSIFRKGKHISFSYVIGDEE